MATVRSEDVEEMMREKDRRLKEQIDRLQDVSSTQRALVLGDRFFDEIEKFYNLSYLRQVQSPTFRPNVMLPELQLLMTQEASDLMDISPKIYVTETSKKKRRDDIEKFVQAQWQEGFYNLKIFYAVLWALFTGTGWIQVKWDPFAKGGVGMVDLIPIDPRHVYPDPMASTIENAFYVLKIDEMYIDEIRARWPDRGYDVTPQEMNTIGQNTTGTGTSLRFTAGPMRSTGNLSGSNPSGPNSMTIPVRTLWIRDSSTEDVSIPAKNGVARITKRLKYPNGRVIIEAGGVILSDGPNMGSFDFPIVPFYGMPNLSGIWGPPPINYTKEIQHLAEKYLSRVYENAIRMNNAICFVRQGTGIDTDSFGGLPGEIVTINRDAQVPTFYTPPPFSAQHMDMPKFLLEYQKSLQGFNTSRLGNPGAGNISSSLYEGSISQGQSLTRARAKLLAKSIQKISEIVISMMVKFYTPSNMIWVTTPDGPEMVEWAGTDKDELGILIDPGSIRPLSQTAMRLMVPKLKEAGMLDVESALELLDIPNRHKIMERLNQDAERAFLAKQAQKK